MTITENVYNTICKTLEKGNITSKELKDTLELVYQEWEYILRGE